MVAYSFRARFAAPILAGIKAQTIRTERAGRSRHARPGEPLQLFTGMRTKQCRLLGEPSCIGVEGVRIELPAPRRRPEITIANDDGMVVRTITDPVGLDRFARADGFEDFADLFNFWRANHPDLRTFQGRLIRWAPLAPDDALDIAARSA